MKEEACKNLALVIILQGGGIMAVGSRRLYIGDESVLSQIRAGDGFIDIAKATPDLVWSMAKALEATCSPPAPS